MPSDRYERTWKANSLTAFVVVCMLFAHGGLCVDSAFRMSVTGDEFWHIPTGLWNLRHGQFHYENLNPPLVRVLSALPLVAMGAEAGDVPEDADKETRADAFVAANRDRYNELVSWARLAPILTSMLTGFLIATWALEGFGRGAAVVATALWAFSPNVIAHASLVTTDVASAGAMLLVMWVAWKFADEPDMNKAIWLGVVMGLAQLVKFTCVIVIPLALAVWIIRRIRNRDVFTSSLLMTIFGWLVVYGVCILVINAGYLFRGSGQPFGDYNFQSNAMQQIATALKDFGDWPVPFPRDYVEGIDHQRHIMEGDHPTYLDDEMRFRGGFRDYYVKAWWYKTPHAIQLICALSLLALLWPKRSERNVRLQIILGLPTALLFAIASLSAMQLGIRYLIPVYPFLFIFASQIASVGRRKFGMPQLLSLIVVAGLMSALRFHPHHIPYFNELSGGPDEGATHLIDSNVDWGQGLLEVQSYLKERGIDECYLAYFGVLNPADIGIPFRSVTQSDPANNKLWPEIEPGTYIISPNFYYGRPGMMRDPDGEIRISGPHQFGYFRALNIDDRIGNCMFVFDVTADEIALMPDD